MEEPIYWQDLFPGCRVRFSKYVEFMDEAGKGVLIAKKVSAKWRAEIIEPVLPIDGKPLSLRVRSAMFAVLVTQRGASLAEGLARELEADALFPAGAVARALLELVALTSSARKTIPAAAAKLPDVEPVHVETFRYLMGTRGFGTGVLPRWFDIGYLMAAAKGQFGDHFGDDYGLLSDLSHPNGVVPWSLFSSGQVDFEPTGISDSAAELLLKVCGQGVACVVRNCSWLVDWATENNVQLPFVLAVDR